MPQSKKPEAKKKNRLDELYEYGKSKGTITYKEIMDRLVELEMDADQLDHVLETLEAYGCFTDPGECLDWLEAQKEEMDSDL